MNPGPRPAGAGSAPCSSRLRIPGKAVVIGDSGPDGGKPPALDDDFIFDASDARVDAVWRKVSDVVGRQNMGARLFNVASMLSNVLTTRGQRQWVLIW